MRQLLRLNQQTEWKGNLDEWFELNPKDPGNPSCASSLYVCMVVKNKSLREIKLLVHAVSTSISRVSIIQKYAVN